MLKFWDRAKRREKNMGRKIERKKDLFSFWEILGIHLFDVYKKLQNI